MSQDIQVPQMGESITEGVLAVWMVSDGAYVNEGDPIFELETEKVSTEVPAPCSGVITFKAKEGDDVQIGAVVASIDSSASAPTDADKSDKSDKSNNKSSAESSADPTAEPAKSGPESKSEKTADTTKSSDASKESSTNANTNASSDQVKAGPAARKLMAEQNVNPASVQATGKHGTITKADVLNAQQAASEQTNSSTAPTEKSTDNDNGVQRKRMSTLRQRIATRLVQAQHTAAILTTFNEIDMHNCMELRKRLKDDFEEKHGVRLGFMSFFTKACTEALKAFPLINAQIEGSDVVSYEHAHISVAVGTDKGLVVPVLRNADQMSFADVEREIRVVAKKARDGKLSIDDMSGGTFTITNGGVYGSLLSTPILNPPQSGILGMHSIQDRPVAINGEVVIRPMMYVALSYDHRIVDGSEAVGFLVHIKKLIEDPERMLLGL